MKNSTIHILYTVARIGISIPFLIAGFHKILAWSGPAAWMASKGLPFVKLLLGITTFVEIIGALLIMFNVKVKWTSIFMAIFLTLITVFMHTFWNMEGMMFQTAFLDFIQNIAIIGGLLGLAVVDATSRKSMPSEGVLN